MLLLRLMFLAVEERNFRSVHIFVGSHLLEVTILLCGQMQIGQNIINFGLIYYHFKV